jgi:DNA-binding MarR family transcriptional regulator
VPPPPPPGLSALLVQARRALRQALAARLQSRGIGPREAAALIELARKPASTPGELAQELALDPPATSRLVSELNRQRLVENLPDREDRRRTRLVLTAAGRVSAAELSTTTEALEAEAARGLAPEELEVLRRALSRLADNLRAAAVPADRPAARTARRARRSDARR